MVVFSNLQDVIGQFPYYTPTVFNFFDAEFAPSVLVSEASGSLPGPELEIFTPGYVSSYVNLMASDTGCGTLDFEVGISAKTTLNGNSRSRCPRGRF